MNNVERHGQICKELNRLYERKNSDYGDIFHISFVEEGMAMARIRLGDKFNRFKTLSRQDTRMVEDESIRDTLIDLAVDADIPMVLINREPLGVDADGNTVDESYPGIIDNAMVCYVGADARQSGTYQGEIVAALDNKGDMNGDGKVSYVMITGDPENPDAQYRTEFSIKALTDAGVEVEELTAQIGNWDTNQGQQIAQNALNQFGDQIDVIFCNNDGMALGAAAAIEQAGRKVGENILLLGVDALEECQQMVQNGTMTGTVLNDHIGQSHKAVDVAVQALNGESIDNYYWVDYVKVDASYFA